MNQNYLDLKFKIIIEMLNDKARKSSRKKYVHVIEI